MGGRRGEVAHGGRARVGDGGSLFNLSTGLIWLVTRVGGWGEAWGGGPWRAGKGGRWGGSNKRCTDSSFWAPLKTGQLV